MTRKPQPPKRLDADGKALWRRLVGEVQDNSPGTLLTLEQFCFAWGKWLAAEDDDSRLRWSRTCRQWLAELKLTPKSRSARKQTGQESDDPILSFIRKAE